LNETRVYRVRRTYLRLDVSNRLCDISQGCGRKGHPLGHNMITLSTYDLGPSLWNRKRATWQFSLKWKGIHSPLGIRCRGRFQYIAIYWTNFLPLQYIFTPQGALQFMIYITVHRIVLTRLVTVHRRCAVISLCVGVQE
jgi:hypothetical protein